ncbi:hypothetical protein V8G61_05790 [Gaetbulibacter sp. M240]|uniref:hypothetical protein n=1 Tax=Gaetbulibacter sp. M240 TaxID=3126511 RepID=UPI00374F5416
MILFVFLSIMLAVSISGFKPFQNQNSSYSYWPDYQHLDLTNLDTIAAQNWINNDHIVHGWDWSLPEFVEPAPGSLVGLQRIIGLNKEFQPLDLKFKSNAVGILWVKWRDIEPTEGQYNFEPIINRIKQANKVGSEIILRILCHSKSRGSDDKALQRGEAPLWLEDLGVNLLPKERSGHNLNFDPAHPVFHKHYLALIKALKESGIPNMVKAAYTGYASHSFGDEGIGPFREQNSAANDTVRHVRERLDAWGQAFKGQEDKVFMGAPSDYGFRKGFGVRRGFVEMYLYRIPSQNLGQYINEEGYLMVDEDAPIMKYNCFNGEVNEEYEKAWATSDRGFQFGKTTEAFPYRYFTSNLRALQMRCNYIHTTGHLIPKMLPFIALELGRTVENAPDVWTYLRTSFIKPNYYKKFDYRNRIQTEDEKQEGIPVKNFERWLYQRDAPGFETQPEIKIEHPIEMWMVQPGKYFDYIARSGKKIGFDIDDRWQKNKDKLAIKITYIDKNRGQILLKFNEGTQMKSLALIGDQKLKTGTFFIDNMTKNSMSHNFDFTLEAGENTDNLVVSMVRVVATKK